MDVVEEEEGVSAPEITLVEPKAAPEITTVKPEAAIKTTTVKPEATETTLVEPETAIAKLEFTTGGKAAVEFTAPACRLC
jgi:hypothetical protein